LSGPVTGVQDVPATGDGQRPHHGRGTGRPGIQGHLWSVELTVVTLVNFFFVTVVEEVVVVVVEVTFDKDINIEDIVIKCHRIRLT